MNVLVTGAAGFIGSHLVDYLITQGHSVAAIDNLSLGFKRNVNPKATFYNIDLINKKDTLQIFKKTKPVIVYHLAADASEGRSQFTPIASTEQNYNIYLHVLTASIKSGIKRMILTSSIGVYGDQKPPFSEETPKKPIDIYGIAKTAMEETTKVLANVYKFEYVILRPYNVYGPRQSLGNPYRNVLGIFINRLLQNKPFFIYGNGMQKRSFTYIDDVAPYMAKAGFIKEAAFEAINLGSNEPHTVNELASLVLSHFVKDIRHMPKNLNPIYLPDRLQEVKYAYCANLKAGRILGSTPPVALKEGIAKMVAWAKSLGPQKFHYLKELELGNYEIPETWRKKLI